MSKKQVTLNSHQLHELRWFCKNVNGTRTEYYEIAGKVDEFKAKLDRLMRTAEMIEKFLKDMGEDSDISPYEWIDWSKPEATTK